MVRNKFKATKIDTGKPVRKATAVIQVKWTRVTLKIEKNV